MRESRDAAGPGVSGAMETRDELLLAIRGLDKRRPGPEEPHRKVGGTSRLNSAEGGANRKKARGRKHGILSRDTWKRRFFSLSNGQLNYYTGQTGTLKGSIEIKATTLACPVPAVSNKTHCFEIRDSNSPQPLLLLALLWALQLRLQYSGTR